jgi:N-acetylglucosaminyldiphosphoundecaprenol N-acetyl-beta-D-mannosaminyltransferase
MLRELPRSPDGGPDGTDVRCLQAGLGFHPLTEAQVVQRIVTASLAGRGGWVATPNIDICRQVHQDEALHRLVASASLIVPDGMPLIWAARLARRPLPERVTGASLIFSLTEAAARQQRTIYLLGGAPGVPEQAAEELRRRYPGLVVAGTDAPPLGFDTDPQAVSAVRANLAAMAPDIVYVGLGFPKQERLIARLAPFFPATWFISCGAAIPFAANALPRAPQWMQAIGLEWMFRLLSEPRRLYRRYLLHDVPFAVRLLAVSAMRRYRRTGAHARAGQTDQRYHPPRTEIQPTEIDGSLFTDSTARHYEPKVTTNHEPVSYFPALPTPAVARPSTTESEQRSPR